MSNSKKSAPRFVDVRFRAHVREHESSTFLGYADATLVVSDALGKGIDLTLRIRGIQVKIVNGQPRIDFPQEQSQNGNWYPHIFPKNAETRVALTTALLSDRMVHAVVASVMEDQDRVAS